MQGIYFFILFQFKILILFNIYIKKKHKNRIPLDYVDLGEMGGVCVVREELNPQINSDNNWDSYTCN